MKKNELGGIEAKKMAVGEIIHFDEVIVNSAFTQYGETDVCIFADEEGKVTRKVFSNSLGKWLRKNPGIKSVHLKKKIVDGEMTYNVFETA